MIHRTSLSPDNFIQAPGFTQSYNRYSYVLNNPLKYTDPSGQRYDPVKRRRRNGRGGFGSRRYTKGRNRKGRDRESWGSVGGSDAWWDSIWGHSSEIADIVGNAFHRSGGGSSGGGRGNSSGSGGGGSSSSSSAQSHGVLEASRRAAAAFREKHKNNPAYALSRANDEVETNSNNPILTNSSSHIIYFKPEGEMTIDGNTYNNNEAYPLSPGETWEHGFDGVAAPHLRENQVLKVTNGVSLTITNSEYTLTNDNWVQFLWEVGKARIG